ncbi:MAG: chemotaxis response regulator protein-glutamate methylesterase [Candidatus Competibacteraceae bacterium]|nr:MAG: chemotaxis response regulator protein-glutamate methylesterase [Candidatus Competibacteraceae bacterium]
MRVVVADDSALFRRLITTVLASLPEVEVVGQAANGKQALQRVHELTPDLLTLDMEMPELNGLEVLDALQKSGENVAVLIISAFTHQGGRLTIQALQKGAFDFITKPDLSGLEQIREALRAELAPRLKAQSLRFKVRNILRNSTAAAPIHPAASPVHPAAPPIHAASPTWMTSLEGINTRMNRLAGTIKPEMVLIGVSTGGPNALAGLLPALPGDLGVPVLIVQHMPPLFTQSLAENLTAKCALQVCEAAHGENLEPNTVYIAPGGRQMRLAPGDGGRKMIQITDDPPENNCRPSVDYLFRSVANQFSGRAMAVILTGMGSDGMLGLRLLKRHGCFVIAQDEPSCVVYGMPKAAVDAGVVDMVLPLEAIAGPIVAAIQGRMA